jgi:hypothetical protein
MTNHKTKVDEFAKAAGIDLGNTPDTNDEVLDAAEDKEEKLSSVDFWNRLHRLA